MKWPWGKKKPMPMRLRFLIGTRDGTAVINPNPVEVTGYDITFLPRIGDMITTSMGSGRVMWVIHDYLWGEIRITVGT